MAKHCEDCGSKCGSHGCYNCNEESYIYHDQMLPQGITPSKRFKKEVMRQKKKEDDRKRGA